MSKLYTRKVDQCNHCPHGDYRRSDYMLYCALYGDWIGPQEEVENGQIPIPLWCPLPNIKEGELFNALSYF